MIYNRILRLRLCGVEKPKHLHKNLASKKMHIQLRDDKSILTFYTLINKELTIWKMLVGQTYKGTLAPVIVRPL